MSHMNRSQIHFAYFRSVLFLFCGLVYLGCARTTLQVFSSTLKFENEFSNHKFYDFADKVRDLLSKPSQNIDMDKEDFAIAKSQTVAKVHTC